MIEELTLEKMAALLPSRAADAHKGHFGHVLVIAGARGYVGAAKLAAEGALRSGAGLVTLAVPDVILDAAAVGLSEAMTQPLRSVAPGVLGAAAAGRAASLASTRDAVVLGPGMTQADDAARFVDGFLRMPGTAPLVLDADGLNAVAAASGDTLRACSRSVVITPHPGEAARLLHRSTASVQGDRVGTAQALLACGASVAVLKGSGTLVAGGEGRLARNTTGGHGLAKGGSGDVLAGLLGGLLAQGMAPYEAACLAVFVHGLAGDIAQARCSARAMLARDLLAALGEAWLRLEAAA
jgi:hydroxyethylthiazole kinase-like uncharacterized protein yjeF